MTELLGFVHVKVALLWVKLLVARLVGFAYVEYSSKAKSSRNTYRRYNVLALTNLMAIYLVPVGKLCSYLHHI